MQKTTPLSFDKGVEFLVHFTNELFVGFAYTVGIWLYLTVALPAKPLFQPEGAFVLPGA